MRGKSLHRLVVGTVFIALLVSAACAEGDTASIIRGRVIDARTHNPLPGAVVIARWWESRSAIVDSFSACVHVETAITDDQGDYQLPVWKGERMAGIGAFNPGYEEYWPQGYDHSEDYKQNVRYLKPFSGTREERLKYLDSQEYATRCSGAKESAKNMLPFYRATHDEAQGLVKTKEDQKIADGFLSDIETIELGYDAALKRSIERAQRRESEK